MATEVEVNPSALEFVSSERRMLIGGEWVEAASGKTFEVLQSGHRRGARQRRRGRRRGHRSRGASGARRVRDRAVAQHDAVGARARRSIEIADLIVEHGDELAALETLDNGKPMAVARAADVPLAVDHFRYYAGWATRSTARRFRSVGAVHAGRRVARYTLREPVGVVGQIIPWNFPLLMAAWKLGPGAGVRLHGRAQAGRADAAVGAAAGRADPRGRHSRRACVNIVTGFGETAGAALAAHRDVDKVAFTGSTEVGKLIVQAAAGQPEAGHARARRQVAEHRLRRRRPRGGDPGRGERDLLQPRAVLLRRHRGCSSSRSVYDEVVEGVAEQAKKIKVGTRPRPGDARWARWSRQEQFDRVCGYIDAGESEGAKARRRRQAASASEGYFVEPTVFTRLSPT